MINMDEFKRRYAAKAKKAQQIGGISNFFSSLNGFLDEELKHKREKEKIAEDRTYETERTNAANAEWERRNAITSGQATDAALLQNQIDAEQTRLAKEQQDRQNEQLAPWQKQASDARLAIYSDPNSPDYSSYLAAIEEANSAIVQLQGVPMVDMDQVVMRAQQLRTERRAAATERIQDRTEKIETEFDEALDAWGAAALGDKAEANNTLAKAAIRYQMFVRADNPTVNSIVDMLSPGASDSAEMSPAEQKTAASFLAQNTPEGAAGMLPKLAATDPDSFAVAKEAIIRMGEGVSPKKAEMLVAGARADYLAKPKRTEKNVLSAWENSADQTRAAIAKLTSGKIPVGVTERQLRAAIKEDFPKADVDEVLKAIAGF